MGQSRFGVVNFVVTILGCGFRSRFLTDHQTQNTQRPSTRGSHHSRDTAVMMTCVRGRIP